MNNSPNPTNPTGFISNNPYVIPFDSFIQCLIQQMNVNTPPVLLKTKLESFVINHMNRGLLQRNNPNVILSYGVPNEYSNHIVISIPRQHIYFHRLIMTYYSSIGGTIVQGEIYEDYKKLYDHLSKTKWVSPVIGGLPVDGNYQNVIKEKTIEEKINEVQQEVQTLMNGRISSTSFHFWDSLRGKDPSTVVAAIKKEKEKQMKNINTLDNLIKKINDLREDNCLYLTLIKRRSKRNYPPKHSQKYVNT